MYPTLVALLGDQVTPLLRDFGSVGLILAVFAESGLITGFFLPGDSALFAAGILSADGVLTNVWTLSIGCFIAAVIGGQVGYATGRRLGPAVFRRPDSLVFRQSRLREAEYYFARRGTAAIVVSRWIPLVRTFAPVVAGASKMPQATFTRCNVAGAAVWVFVLTQAGYWLGTQWPWLGDRLELITVLIVVVSVMPLVGHTLLRRRRRTLEFATDLELATDDV